MSIKQVQLSFINQSEGSHFYRNKKLLKKKVIDCSTREYNEFISGIFTRNKKDGSKRMILNLKNFNKFVNYKHFIMESINNVLNIIRPNMYIWHPLI